MNNDIIGFTETQINPWDSTCKSTETLDFFNVNFNSSENNYLSLAYGCTNVAVLNKFLMKYLFLASRNMVLPTQYSQNIQL